MSQRFLMENDAIPTMGKTSAAETDNLGNLVRQLGNALEPLMDKFNGVARQKLDQFHGRVEEIATALNNASVGMVESMAGQNKAFVTHLTESEATISSAESNADFSAADATRFAAK